jgi:hypothetical protein
MWECQCFAVRIETNSNHQLLTDHTAAHVSAKKKRETAEHLLLQNPAAAPKSRTQSVSKFFVVAHPGFAPPSKAS